MKTLILIATLLNLNTARAFQVPIEPVLDATFQEMDIQHSYLVDSLNGSIEVDLAKEEVQILLQQPSHCPKDLACIALAPAPAIIRLPIVQIYDDWCGSTTIVAEKDNTPVDGILETVVVRDYSQIVCRIHMPFKTEVQYKTYSPWTNLDVISTFQGDALTERPQLH